MLHVFVEFQTPQIVQLWYQTLKPLFVPYFCLEIAGATKKDVKLDANWSGDTKKCVIAFFIYRKAKQHALLVWVLSRWNTLRPPFRDL